MMKPVAVFRSRGIGDPRYTARLDKNSHSVVRFPSFSRYITSRTGDGRYLPHGQWSRTPKLPLWNRESGIASMESKDALGAGDWLSHTAHSTHHQAPSGRLYV
jgi:hypothetical protein